MGNNNKRLADVLTTATMMMTGYGYDSYYDRPESKVDYTPCKYKGMSNKELGTSKKKKHKRK